MNHFVFTGPESSGKTTLAKYFTEQENGVFVPEFAREYLNKLKTKYLQDDLLKIAKGQFLAQENAKIETKNKVFFDTDLLTIKIWSEYKYGHCDQWILDRILSNKNGFYILCKPDIEWEEDELRENPFQRDELYQIYYKNLKELDLNFIEIKGELSERISSLVDFI